MPSPRWIRRIVLAVLLVVCVCDARGSEALAQGCAMCKTALGGPEDPLARGLNISILFLLSMPFLLAGTVGAWLLYLFRRGHRRRPALRLLATPKEGTS